MWLLDEMLTTTATVRGRSRAVAVRFRVRAARAAADTPLEVVGPLRAFSFDASGAELTGDLRPAELADLERQVEEHLVVVRAGIEAELQEVPSGRLLGAILGRGGKLMADAHG